jgi:hypothetical protein
MQLETEIAKSVAKEKVLAALEENERSKIIQPVRTNILSRLSKTKVNSQAKVNQASRINQADQNHPAMASRLFKQCCDCKVSKMI